MKGLLGLVGLALGALTAAGSANELERLKVLYLGDPGTPRAKEFENLLSNHVAQVQVVARNAFKPAEAMNWDVVLLDWPQPADQDRKRGWAPLGERDKWSKPTVLLGSAGLNLAVVWKVRGGSG